MDHRVSSNYKLDTGEAAITYAIRKLWNTSVNVNENNKKNFI